MSTWLDTARERKVLPHPLKKTRRISSSFFVLAISAIAMNLLFAVRYATIFVR